MTHWVEPQVRQVASFILERLRRLRPRGWKQAKRKTPRLELPFPEALALFNEHQLFRVPEDACLGLLRWAEGSARAVLLESVPPWREVLRAQALGHRLVTASPSLQLPSSELAGLPRRYLQEDPVLGFVLHDLRHLHKLFLPELYDEQVGFFRALDQAVDTAPWQEAMGQSETFAQGVARVAADMNAAAPFLFLALKAAWLSSFGDQHPRRWVTLCAGLGIPALRTEDPWRVAHAPHELARLQRLFVEAKESRSRAPSPAG